jgi:DNA-3-methyladenine glycosylase II
MIPFWEEAKEHLQNDAVLGGIITDYPGEGLKPRGDLFFTLVRSIAGQQISVKAADSVWRRFMTLVQELSPENILSVAPEDLRKAGLSGRKIEYILGIATEGARLAETSWADMEDPEVLSRLCGLRGVGEWTAQMVMIFSLCRPDILPLADIGLQRAVEKHYAEGKRLSAEEITTIAEPWRPWRSVATWYLWRSLDPVPVDY